MFRERIAILTGGDSSERDVSLQTAASVEGAFGRLGIDCELFDVANFRQALSVRLDRFTRVFLALHGGFGEDGTVQAYLTGIGMPYNGASPQASAICMSKVLTKYVAQGVGIRVPQSIFCPHNTSVSFSDATGRLGDRFIVKPDGEGCSIGISLVHDCREFDQAVKVASSFGRGILLEEFVEGQEITVGYLDREILPPLAIGFAQDFFSFEAKFESDETTNFSFIDLGVSSQEKVERAVSALGSVLRIADYFRTDFIIRDGDPYLLEVNTLPGLNRHSVFPQACLQASIGYDRVIALLNGASENSLGTSNRTVAL